MKTNDVKQIKSLIRKAVSLIDGEQKRITLSSKEDCSKFVSNLFGFSSWQEVKHASSQAVDIGFTLPIIDLYKKFSDVPLAITVFNLKPLITIDKIKEPSSRVLKDVIDIGTEYNERLKADDIMAIRDINTLVISDLPKDGVFDTLIEGLNKSNTSKITLGSQQNILLDPWRGICQRNSKVLDDFMAQADTNVSKLFTLIFHNIIDLNYSLDLEDAVNYLGLAQMVSFCLAIEKAKIPSAKYLRKYLVGLGISFEDGFILTEEQQQKNWENVKEVYYLLNTLLNLYKSRVFSKSMGEDEIYEMLCRKEEILISDEFISFPFYQELVYLELTRVLNKYAEGVPLYLEDKYRNWFVIEDLYKWPRLNVAPLCRNRFLCSVIFSKPEANLDGAIKNSFQIIYEKSLNVNISDSAKSHLLDIVESWPQGFWYNNVDSVRSLQSNEGFYFYPVDEPELSKDFKKLKWAKTVFF